MSADGRDPAALTPLGAAGPAVPAVDAIAQLAGRLREDPPEGRPRVVATMIASVDGRAAVHGTSVPLSNPADRAILRTLRAEADVVLLGTATLRNEGYGKLIDPDRSAVREAQGRPATPAVATITRRGDVPWEAGLFAEPTSRALVYSGVPVSAPESVAAQVEVIAGTTAIGDVLADLRARHGARLVSCEGGPRLLHAVVAAGLLDELLITISPVLVAGEAPTVLAGDVLDPPSPFELLDVGRAGSHVMLRYGPPL